MKKIVKKMLKIYIPYSNLDWLNYKLVKENLTAHHIIKRCDGGKLEWNNIAILNDVSHQYLHLIECLDINTYDELNKMFKFINQQKEEPTEEQRQIIEFLLCDFEKEHRWDKGSNGKLLLQYKYLKRDYQS